MTGRFIDRPPKFIKLLANDLRWSLLKALTVSDRRVHELVELVDQPMNLVSYHLKKLREDDLVLARRSDADGRDVYYSLDLDKLRRLYRDAGAALHPALPPCPELETRLISGRKPRILFLCTHNSARSQMAEGLMRHLSKGQVEVYSAGSAPAQVHPDAIATMAGMDIDIRGQRAKHFDEFETQSFDYVITVCDQAREVCPVFPGGEAVHWSFPDPAGIEDAAARIQAFEETARRLKSRIEYLSMDIF